MDGYIIGAGDLPRDLRVPVGATVVCADGGYAAAIARGIVPTLAVGDFDSLGYVPVGVETVVLPREKDVTDMRAAADCAIARGCDCLHIYGGVGGRLDHTLANIALLAALSEEGHEAYLFGEGYYLTAVRAGQTVFVPGGSGVFSVFAWGGDAEGVTITDAEYPLPGARLVPNNPLGVSNATLPGKAARVSLSRGVLILLINARIFPKRS